MRATQRPGLLHCRRAESERLGRIKAEEELEVAADTATDTAINTGTGTGTRVRTGTEIARGRVVARTLVDLSIAAAVLTCCSLWQRLRREMQAELETMPI